MAEKGGQRSLWGDGNVPYPDLDGIYTGEYMRENIYATRYV